MNDGQNMNQIISNRVKNTVWKPGQECATYARDDFCVKKRDLLKTLELEFKSQFKFSA